MELSASQQHILGELLTSIYKLVPREMSLESTHSLVMVMHKELQYGVAMVENEEREQEMMHLIEQQHQDQMMAEAEALLTE